MTQQPGEPPAGPGTDAAAEAARERDDPGALQVDLGTGGEDGEQEGEQLDGGLAEGVHEADKNAAPG